MKVDKTELLLLYGILFQTSENASISDITRRRISLLMERMEEYFDSLDDESLEEADDDSDEEPETLEVDELLNPRDLVRLKPVTVTRGSDLMALEFDVDVDNSLEALLSGGAEVITPIEAIKVSIDDKTVYLYSEGTWVPLKAEKIPKAWSILLIDGKTYGVSSEGE